MIESTKNREGLDWSEWFHAAGYSLQTLANQDSKSFQALRSAWEAGADPSDWRDSAPKRLPSCSCGVDRECERHPYVFGFEVE